MSTPVSFSREELFCVLSLVHLTEERQRQEQNTFEGRDIYLNNGKRTVVTHDDTFPLDNSSAEYVREEDEETPTEEAQEGEDENPDLSSSALALQKQQDLSLAQPPVKRRRRSKSASNTGKKKGIACPYTFVGFCSFHG